MPCTGWLLNFLGLVSVHVSVHVILDLYGVGHEFVDVENEGVRLGQSLPPCGRKIVPTLLDYGVALDIDKHAVLLDYAVVLLDLLPVALPMVHAVTSYTGVCAIVINSVILGCFCAGTPKKQKWGNYKHSGK